MKTCRLGGPDHQQTEVRGLQNGQVVLLASNQYRQIGHCRSILLCYGCMRHRVQGHQNDGSNGTGRVGKKTRERERILEKKDMCVRV